MVLILTATFSETNQNPILNIITIIFINIKYSGKCRFLLDKNDVFAKYVDLFLYVYKRS